MGSVLTHQKLMLLQCGSHALNLINMWSFSSAWRTTTNGSYTAIPNVLHRSGICYLRMYPSLGVRSRKKIVPGFEPSLNFTANFTFRRFVTFKISRNVFGAWRVLQCNNQHCYTLYTDSRSLCRLLDSPAGSCTGNRINGTLSMTWTQLRVAELHRWIWKRL